MLVADPVGFSVFLHSLQVWGSCGFHNHLPPPPSSTLTANMEQFGLLYFQPSDFLTLAVLVFGVGIYTFGRLGLTFGEVKLLIKQQITLITKHYILPGFVQIAVYCL